MTFHTNIFRSFLILSAIILLTGCYTDFEPNLESTPVVCINSIITPGERIRAEVTRTWRYSEGDPNSDNNPNIWLDNADVSLYVNGNFKEKMEFTIDTLEIAANGANNLDRYYRSNYVPKIGDEIKIIANDSTYGEAQADVTIPNEIKINNVDVDILSKEETYDENRDTYTYHLKTHINVNFSDPPSDVNYYLFEMFCQEIYRFWKPEHVSNGKETIRIYTDYTYEPIFSGHITPIETIITDALGLYTMFSDRQISGKNYSLTIPVEIYYNIFDYTGNENLEADGECSIKLRLCHISESYYKYMLSLWSATEGVSGALGDVGLGDPVFEFSNVSTGAGIVAAQSYSEWSINKEDLISTEVSTN